MLRTVLASVLLAAVLILPVRAQETICTQRNAVLKQLSHQFKEAPVAMGLANNGGMIELLSTSEGNTWTIIITMPDGTSCLVAAGESWERLPKFVKGPSI